jgi:hypothetical protein
MTAKKKAQPAEATTVVYCGPTIPGVAKQFTFYRDGIPEAMKAAREKTPAMDGLLVPLEELPEAMRQLREGSGPIYTLYRVVQGNH